MKKIVKYLLLAIYLLALAVHLLLLWVGAANVFTTLLAFTTFFWLLDFLFRKIFAKHPALANMRLAAWSLCIALLAAELSLRYVFKTPLTYTESTGFFYISPYRQIAFINFLRRYEFGQQDVGLNVQPYESAQEGGSEFEYAHYYNALGLRDRNYSKAEIDSCTVALGLGDSFTEGIGAPQDSTWIRQLEGLLRTPPPRNAQFKQKPALCINGGANGSDPFYEFYKLKNLLLENYNPQYVILNVNTSDINDVIVRGGMERFVSKTKVAYREPPWWETFYAFSFIARNIAQGVFGIERNLFTPEDFKAEEAKAMARICDCLLHDYAELSAREGFRLLAVFSPTLNEAKGQDTFAPCQKQLAQKGIAVINLLPAFQHYEGDLKELFWQVDGHNNAKGYGLWAQEIYKAMMRDTAQAHVRQPKSQLLCHPFGILR